MEKSQGAAEARPLNSKDQDQDEDQASKPVWGSRSTRHWTPKQRAKYANWDNPSLWAREGGITAERGQAPAHPSNGKMHWAKNLIRKLSKSDQRAAKYLINNTASTSNENLAALIRDAEARQARSHTEGVRKIAALRKAALKNRQISEADWERVFLEDDEYRVVRQEKTGNAAGGYGEIPNLDSTGNDQICDVTKDLLYPAVHW
ncbi:hypothetical protein DV735_g3736, partial [Chaetothyriales sp. CBS 134920]